MKVNMTTNNLVDDVLADFDDGMGDIFLGEIKEEPFKPIMTTKETIDDVLKDFEGDIFLEKDDLSEKNKTNPMAALQKASTLNPIKPTTPKIEKGGFELGGGGLW